jgi:tRNA(Phe) wybutosine-synthesizing methylase Tyw3
VKVHATRAIRVWVDIDEGIADFVQMLNEITGIRTNASCQGTIGEGGAAPYEAHVMVTWNDNEARSRLSRWRVEELGANFGYVYPGAKP